MLLLHTHGALPPTHSAAAVLPPPPPCVPPLPGTVCDFAAARKRALPGTDCYGTRCTGRLQKAPSEDLVLLVTYPRYNRAERVVWQETPSTIAFVDLRGWP